MSIHGLFIGNNYEGTANALPDCHIDARNCVGTFEPYCDTAKLITGVQAGRTGILSAGHEIKTRLKPGDLWIITNSGHGTTDTINGRKVEAVVCDKFDLIYDFEFDHLLDDGRADETTIAVFSDSCFSGGLTRGINQGVRTMPVDECRKHAAIPPAKESPLPGVIYFSGCSKGEFSYSTGKGGAMTIAVLKAFGERKDNTTFGQLFKRIAGKGGLLPTKDWPQHPQCSGSAADLKRTLKSFAKAQS